MDSGGTAPPTVLEREMTATGDDFARGLAAAFGKRVEGGPQSFRIVDNGAAMEIDLRVGPPRVIALLRLPTLRVRIRFTAGRPDQCLALLERMDRAMHRGGG